MTAISLTRRGFLAATGAVGAAAALQPRMAFASPENPSRGDVIVLVNLRGGVDGLSLVSPFTMGSYHDLRPTIRVMPPDLASSAAHAGLALVAGGTLAPFEHDGTFGMHPGLAALYNGPWANGDLAIVHGVGMPSSESDTRSHFESIRNWEAGSASLNITTGFLNRFLSATGANDGIAAMASGSAVQRALGGPVPALAIATPSEFGVSGFSNTAMATSVLKRWYGADAAGDVISTVGRNTLAAVDQVRSINFAAPSMAPKNGAVYPSTTFGRGMRDVAQMIRARVGLKVACIDYGSWDTHENMGIPGNSDSWFGRLASEFGAALNAFYTDLGADMGEVTLATISEFGRTIGENGTGGTDHGRGSVMFVMGKGVRGGVHGDFVDAITEGPEGDLAVCNDYRTVLAEVLTTRGGADDARTIFPTWTPQPALGVCAA